MDDNLPYCVEYAKSGRASCQACKKNIAKDTLRLATVTPSPFHDGVLTKWYHSQCFFTKQRPKTIGDIAQFDNIRWEDQQEIKKQIEESANLPPPTTGKGKKRAGAAGSSNAQGDFKVEYAKSSKSTCRGCDNKIVKEEVRVSKKDFESEEARRFGGLDRWYHLECFTKLRSDLQFYAGADSLNGLKALSKEDQKTVKKALPKIKAEDVPPPPKKVKEEPEDLEEENEMKKQNKKLFSIREKLSALSKQELISVLETNEQQIPQGPSAILDHLADVICFGALKPCEKCKGQLVYKSGVGYKCTGDLTEWTKCDYVTQDPKRTKYIPPKHLTEDHPFLATKTKVTRRLVRVTAPSTSSAVKKEDTVDSGPKIQGKPCPLKNMNFVIIGRTQKDKETLKKEILSLGGNVTTKIDENVAAVISTPKEVEKMNKKMAEAEAADIHVISEDFLEEAKEYEEAPILLIKKKSICGWGGDPSVRISNVAAKSGSKGKSKFEKSSSGKMKLQVKGGGAVDPESGLEDCAFVYQKGNDKYTATLGLTDIQSGKNSYYKIQVLKHDKRDKYWLFRNWGRIGTTMGGTKLEELPLRDCLEQFQTHYEEKTGNQWSNREHFVKVPHKMYPIELDHGDNIEDSNLLESDIKSNLKQPVQDLIRLIFNVENMKKVMLEFEIDLEKLPLGKISKKQIEKAYSILTELQDLIKKGQPERVLLIDASNKFYTLIPHNFGVSGPKILETEEEIKQKCEMLESLLELEVAYSLLNVKADSAKNPIDCHYEQLNADIDVLDETDDMYKVIQQYVKNTHAPTHTTYDLDIEQVYVVKRKGEDQRFKPFRKLHNRKLLWHGSRTTNFAGIISQGLRIAPPEAPVTGYMFGKGIYFADMVTKSANYCCTSSQNSTGLLMLCEVALGNMYERYGADYIKKLPKGKHSTFGRGHTHPDPNVVHKTDDNVEVPYGPPVSAKLPQHSSLLYNEYIVYDVAQVKTQYLIKMNFKYKY